MPDLNALSNEVKGLPDQALQTELQHPNGMLPGFLVLAEAQRRETMRQAAQQQQTQGQSSSVYDDVIRSMMARQPPQGLPAPPAGMVPMGAGQPSGGMPGSTPPQNFAQPKPAGMAKGGPIRFAEGGSQSAAQALFNPSLDEANTLGEVGSRESNDDYLAKNPDPKSSASGRYQFTNNTWRDMTKLSGVGGEYKRAMDAPPWMQDLNALTLLRKTRDPNSTYAWAASGAAKGRPYTNPYATTDQAQQRAAFPFPPAPTPAAPPIEKAPPPEEKPEESEETSPPAPAPEPEESAKAPPAPAPEPEKPQQKEPQLAGGPPLPPEEGSEAAASQTIGQRLQGIANPPQADPYAQSRAQLDQLIQQLNVGRATINQLQSQVLTRTQHADPWTYLGNMAQGMADYAAAHPYAGTGLAFAHGAGVANQYKDEARRGALSNYLALEKAGQEIDQQMYALQNQQVQLQGAQVRVTPDILRFLPGVNPASQQPWQVGDTVYGQQALDLTKRLQDVAVKQAEQKPVTQTAQIALVGKSLNLPDDQTQWTNEDWKKVNEQINPGGQLTPSDIDQVARNYINGIPIPPLGRGKYAIRDYEAVVHRVAQLQVEEGDNIIGRRGNIAADNAALKQLQTRASALNTFEGTAGANLDMMVDWAKKLTDTHSPLLNKKLRDIDVNVLGSEDVAAFNATNQVATTEVARVLNNPNMQGALSDSGREEVRSLIPREATLGQVLKTAEVLRKDMANRKLYFDKEIATLQNRLAGYGRPGGAAPSGGAAPAKRYQMNGREIIRQGGGWVYKDDGSPVQ